MAKNKLVQTAYEDMLKLAKEKMPVDRSGKVNCYTCKNCGHVVKTVDIDNGVTPFIIGCDECGENMYSSFYKDNFPEIEPTYEWFRPSLEATKKMSPGMQDHILNGGLDKRKIECETVKAIGVNRIGIVGVGHIGKEAMTIMPREQPPVIIVPPPQKKLEPWQIPQWMRNIGLHGVKEIVIEYNLIQKKRSKLSASMRVKLADFVVSKQLQNLQM